MRLKYLNEWMAVMFVAVVTVSLLFINSPLAAADQGKASGILFIVGNTADESPISGIELEICQQNADGSIGKKIGNFVSQTDKTGDGHIYINLAPGNYCYRVATEGYHLSGNNEWEPLVIEGNDSAVFVWISPVGEELEIEDEKVAQGAPQQLQGEVTHSQDRQVDELEAGTKGNHQGLNLNLLKILEVSNSVWLTLGLLAGIIFGVIGLDYLMRARRH